MSDLDQLAQSAWLATIPYLKDAKVAAPPLPPQFLADQIRVAGRKSENVEDKRNAVEPQAAPVLRVGRAQSGQGSR